MTDSKSKSKSKSKSRSKSSTEALVKTSKTARVELSEQELGAVSGGSSKVDLEYKPTPTRKPK